MLLIHLLDIGGLSAARNSSLLHAWVAVHTTHLRFCDFKSGVATSLATHVAMLPYTWAAMDASCEYSSQQLAVKVQAENT